MPAPSTVVSPLRLPERRVLVVLLVITAALTLIYLATIVIRWSGVVLPGTVVAFLGRFDVDAELTVPTWFSSMVLAAAGILGIVIGRLSRPITGPRAGWWVAVGVILMVLSLDEASALHELSVAPVQRLLHITEGPFLFAWVVPGIVVVIVTLLVFARFFFRLPPDTRLAAGVGGAVFLSGALVMEMVQSALVYRLAPTGSDSSFSLDLLAGLEELLEMTGSAILVWAFLRHLQRHVLAPGGAQQVEHGMRPA